MTTQIGRTRRRAGWRTAVLAVLGAVALGTVLVTPVVGHSELVTPTPADGVTVSGDPPPTISGTYSETLDPAGSSLVLVDSSGKTIATGGVADASQPTKEMAIEAVPTLAPGKYTVKSTTKSAEDGDLDRKTWSFTVEAVASSPSSEPSPSTAPTPSAQPSASASAAATPGGLPSSTPVGTEGDTAPPAQPASSSGDVILPIIVGLAIVLGVAAYLLSRRARPPTTP